ncbi:hypothetical protein [Flavobacterium pectinovorum]|uniref:Lipoprotein n=1 Tax=Flavobacterium pectinovorum TaxID=29533 RepID=A0A502EUX3_9FLAO|nr:hypothetical protein [Flavobacterium pectinovorum]TPG41553.1 hypothetical protein EAH81_08695 [Flavobacterium pectinovorum]
MRKQLIVMLFIFLTACNFNTNNKPVINEKQDSSEVKTKLQQSNTTIIQTDTLIINKHQYIQKLINKSFYCLLSVHGDTIIKQQDYYVNSEYSDIDNDGYDDIRIYLVSKIPNECDTYLYNKERQAFILIENCDLDIQKIKGSQFYYSYNKAGCADLNWESYLSKIENYKLINYGYIIGHGCDFEVEKNPQSISIYKISDSEKQEMKLIQELPYLKNIPKNENKWDFIKRYWQKNFNKFER